MFAFEEIIDLAIHIEKNAEAVYRAALKRSGDSDLAKLLQWLVEEEVRHIEWFQGLKARVQLTTINPQIARMGREMMLDAIGNQSFSLKDADFSKMEDLKDLLNVAMGFENDKVKFFTLLKPFIDDSHTRGQLDAIIAEEMAHARKFEHHLTPGECDKWAFEPEDERITV